MNICSGSLYAKFDDETMEITDAFSRKSENIDSNDFEQIEILRPEICLKTINLAPTVEINSSCCLVDPERRDCHCDVRVVVLQFGDCEAHVEASVFGLNQRPWSWIISVIEKYIIIRQQAYM